MTTMNFPSSPAVNDTYTIGTKTWKWNGVGWAIQGAGGGGGASASMAVTDDTTTNTTYYPSLIPTTNPTASSLRISSTKLTYNPSTGTLIAVDVQASSDERLKTNWRPVPSDLIQRLSRMKTGLYDRTDGPISQIGASAQSAQAEWPEIVGVSINGMLSISYANAAFVGVVELSKKVLALTAEVEELRKQLEAK